MFLKDREPIKPLTPFQKEGIHNDASEQVDVNASVDTEIESNSLSESNSANIKAHFGYGSSPTAQRSIERQYVAQQKRHESHDGHPAVGRRYGKDFYDSTS